MKQDSRINPDLRKTGTKDPWYCIGWRLSRNKYHTSFSSTLVAQWNILKTFDNNERKRSDSGGLCIGSSSFLHVVQTRSAGEGSNEKRAQNDEMD